jgi:hypothetical protein
VRILLIANILAFSACVPLTLRKFDFKEEVAFNQDHALVLIFKSIFSWPLMLVTGIVKDDLYQLDNVIGILR